MSKVLFPKVKPFKLKLFTWLRLLFVKREYAVSHEGKRTMILVYKKLRGIHYLVDHLQCLNKPNEMYEVFCEECRNWDGDYDDRCCSFSNRGGNCGEFVV